MLLWIIYILSEAAIQAKMIGDGFKPNYLNLFFLRGFVSLFHAFPILYVESLHEYIILLGFQTTSFWVIFDLTLNKLRDRPWDYKGATSGWIDKIDYEIYIKLKFLAIFAIIGFYIKGLQYFPF